MQCASEVGFCFHHPPVLTPTAHDALNRHTQPSCILYVLSIDKLHAFVVLIQIKTVAWLAVNMASAHAALWELKISCAPLHN